MVLYRVVHEEPDLTGVDPGLHAIVQDAMSKNPAARPTTADLLRRLAEGGDGRAAAVAIRPGARPAAATATAMAATAVAAAAARPITPVRATRRGRLPPRRPARSARTVSRRRAGPRRSRRRVVPIPIPAGVSRPLRSPAGPGRCGDHRRRWSPPSSPPYWCWPSAPRRAAFT
ncbi:hypothetical protein FMEAI12_3260020 [Parafrankia sp. Ea1.12]|nr:hypothetical protein FMEAI12_3260020 [Parafrankia sp. Ea1.12]